MIRLRDVVFRYGAAAPVLRVESLDIEAGLNIVIGANGSGKTTLLRLIAGVDAPAQGTVTIGDADLWIDEVAARRQLAFVPEHPELTPYSSVGGILRLVADARGAPYESIVQALADIGLRNVADRSVRELSMGQRRRVMLAAALIGTPLVLILDEPFENLDAPMRTFVHSWIVRLRSERRTIVLATHAPGVFASQTDALLNVNSGRVHRYPSVQAPLVPLGMTSDRTFLA